MPTVTKTPPPAPETPLDETVAPIYYEGGGEKPDFDPDAPLDDTTAPTHEEQSDDGSAPEVETRDG